MTTSLAVAGSFRARGFPRRFLVAWAVVSALALPVGMLTGRFPPDRILTFAFCLPILAGFGLVWIGERLRRPGLAWPIAIVLVTLDRLPGDAGLARAADLRLTGRAQRADDRGSDRGDDPARHPARVRRR